MTDFHGYDIRAYPGHLCNPCSIIGHTIINLKILIFGTFVTVDVAFVTDRTTSNIDVKFS